MTLARFSYHAAKRACNSHLKEVAGIDKRWRLPSINEYKVAEKSGIREAINVGFSNWSSDPVRGRDRYAWIFDNYDGTTVESYHMREHLVQCAAR